MSIPAIAASDSGALLGSLAASDAANAIDKVINKASELVRSAQGAMSETVEEETAHMRRRLFRTLDHPDRCIIAIDCETVDVDRIHETSDLFLNDPVFREHHNLVLAVPEHQSFADSPSFDCVQTIKQRAFESGVDGKVSWLLIQQREPELTALKNLVEQQGGKWYTG
ncbi:hypothetical protein [Allorhodopirellula heiligendammensis]|uniref:Uncharacterized protein n=1 Tax=Allorhodopirellula heiligendammensis TaxID=2714739 RepID=A0A5C6BY93_9BACT|nr:hypothetical protein [Allorhodopirellula heiligendammensis]TWU16236.1 hypothetical protein Poly21_34410 [Allorhodopirellula heiligendammensis]